MCNSGDILIYHDNYETSYHDMIRNWYRKCGNFRGVENFAVFVGIFITTKFNFDCLSQKFSYSHENHIVLLEKTKDVNTEVCSPD